MEQILLARQILVNFYKRYESVLLFCCRLIVGIFIFRFINSIGLYREEFAPLFTVPFDFPYIMLSALLFAVLPPTLANGLIILQLLIQISQSLEVMIFVFLLLICVLLFYARVQPRRSFLVIAIIMGFFFRIPYAVVLFSGLYLGLGSIIPIVIGTLIYHFIPLFSDLARSLITPEELDMMAIPNTFLSLYKTVFDAFTSPTYFDWIFIGFSFSMVIITVFAISRLSISYSKDLAVLMGGLVNIICMTIASSVIIDGTGFFGLLIYTIISVIIVEIARFFDNVLDYKRAERVQFEDEDNYYYVKIIPKVIVNKKSAK